MQNPDVRRPVADGSAGKDLQRPSSKAKHLPAFLDDDTELFDHDAHFVTSALAARHSGQRDRTDQLLAANDGTTTSGLQSAGDEEEGRRCHLPHDPQALNYQKAQDWNPYSLHFDAGNLSAVTRL
jgi:hypothetical protein